MSRSARTSAGPSALASATNFSAVFEVALSEYEDRTGLDLRAHAFADLIPNKFSPDKILRVLRLQAGNFDTFLGVDKLMALLKPIVDVLFTLSEAISEALGFVRFSPAKAIYSGISLLLVMVRDEIASYEMLVALFQRVHFFLQRLNRYAGIPLSPAMVELLGKIVVQILSVLALSTKPMNERRTKKFTKGLIGCSDVEDAFQQLDVLTREENLMTAARSLELTHHVSVNAQAIQELARRVDDEVSTIPEAIQGGRGVNDTLRLTRRTIEGERRKQSRERLRTWLAPPDPSINHNIACKIRNEGTASWFLRGKLFNEWKKHGVLWIRGIPGAGKTILCSAVIEDINHMRVAGSSLIAYYYFDFTDAAKRDVRGLLASILIQLVHDSMLCWGVLSKLYRTCRDGLEQPSDAALSQSLKDMLGLPGQLPIFLIVDALDECPNDTGTPSARKRVLNVLKDLIRYNHWNLHICITSRPERDIQSTLDPLIPASRRISLHEEPGQREDIIRFTPSFVHLEKGTQKWRGKDKEPEINKLSKRAWGMFRWEYDQVDTLDRCFSSSLREALDELPPTLEDTYERTLQGIHEENREHAHRLFKCMIAAARPLRVEELAEILAVNFDPKPTPNLVEGWRPNNPEEAVLSVCSTLVSIIDEGGAKIVQFSHISVKDFLTSHRLRTSEIRNIGRYYVPLELAHLTLAQSCIAVLLHLDEDMDKRRLTTLPLALYAARHWVDHARFGSVALRIQDAMEHVFHPKKPFLRAWVWIHDIPRTYERPVGSLDKYPYPLKATPLYYAAFCGFSDLARRLILRHSENVNADCGRRGTPLHGASSRGCVAAARVLLEHGANVNSINRHWESPLFVACTGDHPEVVQLLLEHGADVEMSSEDHTRPLHRASERGCVDVVRLLLQHNADANALDYDNWTPIQIASDLGHLQVAQLLLDHGAYVNAANKIGESPLFAACAGNHIEVVRMLLGHGANHAWSSNDCSRPLHRACERGGTEVVRLLLQHNTDVNSQNVDKLAPLHIALEFGHLKVARLLLEHGADINVSNKNGESPLLAACASGRIDIVRLLLEHEANVELSSDDNSRPLHCASESGGAEIVRLLLQHNADTSTRDFRNWTPLHIASEFGHLEIVQLLLEHGADVNVENKDGESPLSAAFAGNHIEVVQLLLEHGGNVEWLYDDYHAPYLKCRSCHNRIEESSRTSDSIYCIDCRRDGHSETLRETPNERSAMPQSTPPASQSPVSPKAELPPHNISTAPPLTETTLLRRSSLPNDSIISPIKSAISLQEPADSSPPAHGLSESMPNTHSLTTSGPARVEPVLPAEDEVCKGCQLKVRRENGGVVVAFRKCLFHVDCFKCANCNDRIDATATDLVLLIDNQPVCARCLYWCNICHQAIVDDALITGDESYHTSCFRCRSCLDRIDGPVFARTNYGIYCMDCHNKRVTRIVRRAQVQREHAHVIVDFSEGSPFRGWHSDTAGDRYRPGEDGITSTTGVRGAPPLGPKALSERSGDLLPSTPRARQVLVSGTPEPLPVDIGAAPASLKKKGKAPQAATITAAEQFEGPNTYLQAPGPKPCRKQSNYRRSHQDESSGRMADYNLSDLDHDVDVDNEKENDNFSEVIDWDLETDNGLCSPKSASYPGSLLLVLARWTH